MMLSGAQIVIKQLSAHGVKTVFGYPGAAVLPLYDELYKNTGLIEHILTAHEQGAAHAADGYARASGKTGVVIATSGPGAANLVTGIANAQLDSVPLVVITGNVPADLIGRDSFQEVDIMGITQPIVKHNYVVRDIAFLEDTLREAFHIAGSGRRGVVLVDIPRCVQTETYEYKDSAPITPVKPVCNFETERIAEAIRTSKRPFIYAGGGVLAAGACDLLYDLSNRISAPVGLSMMGLTALPHDMPQNLGMTGMHGKYAATMVKSECDLILALGVRFSDRATGAVKKYCKDKYIIHVDIDLAEIGKNVPAQMEVCGDAGDVLKKLLDILQPISNPEWSARVRQLKQEGKDKYKREGWCPAAIIETAAGYCDDDTIIATDVGQHQMWVMQHFKFTKPGTLLTSGGLGAMGFGMGAAIGGCIASGRKRVVLFTGDGSFGMNLIELATAVSQKLPIIIIIMNNNSLGLPRQLQDVFYGKHFAATVLNRKTDFSAVAKAFGAAGYSAGNTDELRHALDNAPCDSPVVIDCHIDTDEQVLPMIPPDGGFEDIIV